MTNSAKQAVIAVDIGTTATKTLAIDAAGRILASHSIDYPLLTPKPGYAEQDPEQLLAAVVAGVRAVIDRSGIAPGQVKCVSFSSAMHSLIGIDRDLKPITPCMTWADQRSAAVAERLKKDGSGFALYRATGTPIHPMSPLIKLIWLKENEPDLHSRAHRWVGIKEYVFAKFFGRCVIDYSMASATGLFDLERLDWHDGALAAAGLTPERLSEPVPTTFALTGLNAEYAEAMGIRPDTPFVVGASDGVLANLGAGAIEPGITAVTIGTSGAVRAVVDAPTFDPAGRLFCYALTEQLWVIGGAVNNGGIALRWARDRLFAAEAEEARRAGEEPYDRLIALAQTAPLGAGGLLFLPLLTGERAPYWNANARGVFFGLSLHHEKRHMLRAVMEGVMLQVDAVARLLEQAGGKAREVRASGGFARSAFWRQMLADVLGTPVRVTQTVDSSGLGAAWLGLYAIGAEPDLAAISRWVKFEAAGLHEPDPAAHVKYRKLSELSRSVYEGLKDRFDDIVAMQEEDGKGRHAT